MPVTSTPAWNAPRSGILGDASAIADSTQINQFLGTHAAGLIYPGSPILTPTGAGGTAWAYSLSSSDLDQPFTMSGTTIGRVAVPLLPVGVGADLLVSLWSDNGSGLPGSMVTQTRIPASWISQLAAVAAPAGTSTANPTVAYTNNPLAAAQFNGFHMGTHATKNWPYPTSGTGGAATAPCSASFGNYFIQMGGSSGSTFYDKVYTIAFDTAGNLSQAIPQPSLPVPTDGSASAVIATEASGDNTIVFMGGQTASGVYSSSVYAAGFDASTGAISAWSTQTALPYVNSLFGAAAYGPYVYMLGGSNPGQSAVYYASVSNGQLGNWTATTPLPAAQGMTYAVAVNGFLYAFGGFITSGLNTSYYAPIRANGSLGAWQAGPSSLPVSTELFNGNAIPSLGDYGILGNGSGSLLLLSSTTNGPDYAWYGTNFNVGGDYYAAAQAGDGQWIYYGLYATLYSYLTVSLTPRISVPLPAAGLTSGATYHIMLQQQGGDLSDYLRTHTDQNMFPGNPTALSSPPGAYTWTLRTTGFGVPIQVFDNSAPPVPSIPMHTWEDNGARIATYVCATTPDRRLLGACEAVAQSTAQNSNTGFESGISPWTVTGGTVVQSQAEVFTGQYAAKMTPSGTAATVYLSSELLACMPGQKVTVEARMWFTSAVTGNASASVNWFTLAGAYLSTSSNNVSVAAATWTDLVNTFTAPAGAYQYTLNPALSGTPAASNVFYVDAASGYPAAAGPQLSTVTEITYPGTYPGGTYPPLGSTVLA